MSVTSTHRLGGSHPALPSIATPPDPPAAATELRLRLEPGDSGRSLLDGGWWPRSTDPVAELPGLVLAIDALHGPITSLVLSADGWADHPRRLAIGVRVVRVGYFASQPVSLLTALTGDRSRVDLLVVAPDTDAGVAAVAMGMAAARANRVPAQHILLMARATPPAAGSMLAEQASETDGGPAFGVEPRGLSGYGRAAPPTVYAHQAVAVAPRHRAGPLR